MAKSEFKGGWVPLLSDEIWKIIDGIAGGVGASRGDDATLWLHSSSCTALAASYSGTGSL